MKTRDLKKTLERLGWWFKREGANHEIWTNGVETTLVVRHRETVETTAIKTIKYATDHPPKGQKK